MADVADITMSPETATVIEYCRAMVRNEIVVNRAYQRSDKIWPRAARSFLIESILLGYPIPKITLRQVTNIETRESRREIVDGQQRSDAILEFYENRLELSEDVDTEEFRGKTLDALERPYKERFLTYRIAIDVFLGTDEEEVRETFRRMNSYMVPLNPEEQRHALYQGPFKWFIHRIAKSYGKEFLQSGLYKEKPLLRMQDMKLLTELSHAFYYGIQTTNKSHLEALYKRFDRTFPNEDEVETRLESAFDQLFSWTALRETELMKPFMVYSLILAIMYVQGPFGELSVAPAKSRQPLSKNAQSNLSELAEDFANRDEELDLQFPDFVAACSRSTNTKGNRSTRFQYFYCAITDQLNEPIA